jgi:ABC-type dipeptide/oligopeptide/nickel transport system permease subunit/ABC-type dipeptide/oligopeptide/nickel transport system permease component
MDNSLGALVLCRIAVFFVSIFLILNVLFMLVFVFDSPVFRYPPVVGQETDSGQILADELKLDESMAAQYANFMWRMLSGEYFTSLGVHRYVSISDFIYEDAFTTGVHFTAVVMLSLAAGGVYSYLASRWSRSCAGKTMLALTMVVAATSAWAAFYALVWAMGELDVSPFTDGINMNVISCSFFPVAAASVFVLERAARSASTDREGTDTNRLLRAISDPGLAGVMPFLLSYAMTTVLIAESLFRSDGIGFTAIDSLYDMDIPVTVVCVYLIGAMLLTIFLLVDMAFIYARFRAREPRRPDPVHEHLPDGGVFASITRQSFTRFVKAYSKSKTGVIALVGLVILFVVSLMAPLLATVEDPYAYDNLEPNDMPNDWRNPHPPSLSPSPYTDFVHPLGTDYMGRDIYSTLLYDSIGSLSVALLLVILALAMGLLAEVARAVFRKHNGPLEKPSGWLAWAVADAFLAVPMFLLLSLSRRADSFDILVLLFILAWIWAPLGKAAATGLLIFDERNVPGGSSRHRIDARTLGRIAHVSKFCVLFVYMSLALTWTFAFYGSWLEFGWADMIVNAYQFGALYRGDWWMLIPAIVMIGLVAVLVFVALDRMERILHRWQPGELKADNDGPIFGGGDPGE